MSRDRQTFTDPKTGQEVKSTRLARWGAGPVCGLIIGLVQGLAYGLGHGLVGGLGHGLAIGLIHGLFGGLACAVLGAVAIGLYHAWVGPNMEAFRRTSLIRWAHDHIARTQHRQRLLRSQEHVKVPDGAISRAQPPGEPEPTDAALSLADEPEETEHLPVSIEEDTQVVVDDNV